MAEEQSPKQPGLLQRLVAKLKPRSEDAKAELLPIEVVLFAKWLARRRSTIRLGKLEKNSGAFVDQLLNMYAKALDKELPEQAETEAAFDELSKSINME